MESPVKTFGIPNELCRRPGIAAKWLPINQIGVFPNQPVNASSRDIKSSYATNKEACVYHVRQDVVLFHPILRRLVNEAGGIFVNVQGAVNSKPSDKRKELLQFSVQYRSVIRACLENLQDEVNRAHGTAKLELQNFVTIFYSVECVWHLCEILYVDNIPGHIVLKYLLEWIRFHFPTHELKAARLLTGDLIGIESHPDYWNTITGSLMQGRIEVARALLGLHSQAHTGAFKLAEQTLKSMPVYDVYNGVSVNEFALRWQHWLLDAQSKLDAKMYIVDQRLNFIMRLVVGEEGAWLEAQKMCESWYELLAAWLLYTAPTAKSFELGNYARKCIMKMGITMHHLDRVILAAMEGDVEIIKEIQNMTENGWFVTHLIDLLHHVGHLEKWQTDDHTSEKLRESFVVEYGTLLMGHHSLWQLGLNYLDHCPTDGLGTIELLLPRIRLATESKVQKVIREAQKRELIHIVHSTSKIQGIAELRRGRLGNALVWALKSQDSNFVSFLADQFLKEYVRVGVLPNEDLLNNLGSCMLASDRLIFLGKYYEFHKLYKSGNFKEAGAALVSLIVSKFTPKFFWCSLLVDAIPLLECDELLLSSNDTFNLLNCVEERADVAELKDKLEVIRLGIARNLARALTFEAQFAS